MCPVHLEGRGRASVFGTLKDHCLELRRGRLSVGRYVGHTKVQRSKGVNEQTSKRATRVIWKTEEKKGRVRGESEGEGKSDEGVKSMDPTRTAKKGSEGDGDWTREGDTEVKKKEENRKKRKKMELYK